VHPSASGRYPTLGAACAILRARPNAVDLLVTSPRIWYRVRCWPSREVRGFDLLSPAPFRLGGKLATSMFMVYCARPSQIGQRHPIAIVALRVPPLARAGLRSAIVAPENSRRRLFCAALRRRHQAHLRRIATLWPGCRRAVRVGTSAITPLVIAILRLGASCEIPRPTFTGWRLRRKCARSCRLSRNRRQSVNRF